MGSSSCGDAFGIDWRYALRVAASNAMVEESTAASYELTTDAEELAGYMAHFKIEHDDGEVAAWRSAESQAAGVKSDKEETRKMPKGTGQLATAGAEAIAADLESEGDGWEDF